MGTVNVVETNKALCVALGLDPHHVRSVTLKMVAGDAPRMTVEYSARYVAEHPELGDAFRLFELVPIDGPTSLGQEWAESPA